jgi:hypothetical protein
VGMPRCSWQTPHHPQLWGLLPGAVAEGRVYRGSQDTGFYSPRHGPRPRVELHPSPSHEMSRFLVARLL